NSFERFVGLGQTVQTARLATHTTNVTPQFQLVDLPSKDKEPFYQIVSSAILIASYYNNGEVTPTFDTNIDVLTGDGTLLYTIQYDRCQIGSYWMYADSNKEDYRMGSEDQTEYRETTSFACEGYHLNTP
ncbi:MAG: hypothetical protein KGI25_06790, partial [Thaumarchaeota archaeon]|nr:hypothetical protein [Nitrososphaerota archaeon]